MRFATAALACNAVCLGFVTGFVKAPAKGVPRATSQSSTLQIGGPLRGLAAGINAAGGNEHLRRGLDAKTLRYLRLLRSGKDDSDEGDNSSTTETQVRIFEA